MNGIAEKTNGLIATKARCLLLDSNLDQSFWPNAFETAKYLLNRTPSSTLDYDIPLEAWLRAYHSHNHNYTQDLSHLRTWGCRAHAHIPQEKRIKSQKGVAPSREGFLVGYIGQNIYKIYFPDSEKVEQLRDVIFVEEDKSLETPLKPHESFYYPELASKMSVETPHNSSATPINKDSHSEKAQNEIPDTDSDISLVNSEIETPPRRSGRIQHAPQKYGNVARHLAMSTVAQEVIHEPLTYNQTLQSPEAVRWQEAMQE